MTDKLFKPVDIAPLVFFRIFGGALIAIELAGEALFPGFASHYVEATFHFSYLPFAWLSPGPPALVYTHMAVNFLAALCVCLGLFYRTAAVVLTVGLSTLFLMEKAAYINHTYLYCLYAGILACIPANAAVSLDANRNPEIRRNEAEAWTLYLLRFQMAVVYLFAAFAKFEPDWLNALPLGQWLAHRADYPLIGPFLALPFTAHFMSWAGMLIDLLIVPAMLWDKSRKPAFLIVTTFHLSNVAVFGIGTFPWFSIVATALFFPPETFRRLSFLAKRLPSRDPNSERVAGGLDANSRSARRTAIAVALSVFALIQVTVPLRRFVYGGQTSWTEAGHSFAWRMMLRTKRGRFHYMVRDLDTGETSKVHPMQYLTPRQYGEAVGDPDSILQLAHHIRDENRREGRNVAVTAEALVALNGRPRQHLVDPEVDLARVERKLGSYDFILPLKDAAR
jgi:hypothetical protein